MSADKFAPARSQVPRDKNRPSAFFEAARVSSVGLEMAVSIGIGWGLGYYLDSRFGTGPWLMLIGLLYGSAAGFRALYKAGKSIQRNAELDGNFAPGAGIQEATSSEVKTSAELDDKDKA